MERNAKIGVGISIFIIMLLVLSILITQSPSTGQNSTKFGILTLLPPIITIILAFITRESMFSLFVGVFVGEFMLCVSDLNIISSSIEAFLKLTHVALSSIADPWHAGIMLQVLLIGGVIQLVGRMGGTQALAEKMTRFAKTPKQAQIITWFLGLCVFFDDYANSLIVGPIMRPIMDKVNVSREKLAFIIDSTAAPIAGIAVVSTWIGLELSLITDGFKSIGMNVNGFNIFLQSIPYRFYNILILLFIVMSALTLYEFGPMKEAEKKARKRENSYNDVVEENEDFNTIKPIEGIKLNMWNAIIPICALIVGSLILMYYSGYTTILGGHNQSLIQLMHTSPFSFSGIFSAFSNANVSIAFFQSGLLASVIAILMAVGEGIMPLGDAVNEWMGGMKSVVFTGVILILAWSLGKVVGDIGTAKYLVGILSNTIPVWGLPALIFILSAVISFASGSAYGTMGILMPLAIPLAWSINPEMGFVVSCVSGVLTGAIFGDHCSPISDTTILSSMGSGCNILDHVNTQLFYALYVAAISIVFCYIPSGFGISWYISIPIAIVVMYVGLRIFGEKVEFEDEESV